MYLENLTQDKAREINDLEPDDILIYNEEFLNLTKMPIELGRFDLLDFTELNFIRAANTAFYVPILYIGLAISHYIACKITKACYKRKVCRRIGVYIYDSSIGDGFIRLILICCLELIICCAITFKEMDYTELF